MIRRTFIAVAAVGLSIGLSTSAFSGSIFLTGHDPDFHAISGNTSGARNINNAAVDYIMDPAFNPFAAGGTTKWIFVEGKFAPPVGHLAGVQGMALSGFVDGVDFDHHDATTLHSALDQLGTTYGGIVVASDFGGRLSQAELNILNSRTPDIIDFLNAGGGIYAMAEGNGGSGLTPDGGHYGFLPFVVSSTAFDQSESGFTVTPFAITELGLSNADVNGNFSHNIFLGNFGLNVVDFDEEQNVLSLAGRIQIPPVPEPSTLLLLGVGLAAAALRGRKRQAGAGTSTKL